MRHVDNCGSYENNIFCEFGKDSSKIWLSISMKQQKRPIGSWRKWGTGQESIKGLAKLQMKENDKFWSNKGNFGKNGEYVKNSSRVWPNIQIRWQKKKEILTVGDFTKLANWENGELGKNPSKFGKTSIEVTKRGILTNGDYNKKMANLGEKGKSRKNSECAKNSSRVWPNIQMGWQKGTCW